MNKWIGGICVVAGALALVSCGGGSDDAPTDTVVAPAEVTAPMNTGVATAVKGEVFEFTAVPELGTSGTTTVAFSAPQGSTGGSAGAGGGSSTNPGFAIASGGFTASGETTFGSCIFNVTQSTFPAGHQLALGGRVTINPCDLQIITQNMAANGVSLPKATVLKLAARISRERPITVVITPSGQVQIGGVTIITVPVSRVTGTVG